MVHHAMHREIDCGAVDYDAATWVRPVSGSDLGQCVRNRMSEPYFLEKEQPNTTCSR